MSWYKRWRARRLWKSMLRFYMDYHDDMNATMGGHFMLGTDYIKRIAEGQDGRY
jgi:hypothetical protein